MYEPTPTLKSLVHGIEVAMLTTVDSDGTLQSRPMYTQEVDANGTLWFFASRSSQQVSAGETWPLVNVTYAHPAKQRYVSICGHVSAVDDPERRRELWSDFARTCFKDGPDDPDLVLLRVDVEHLDFWEGPSNVLTRLIGFTTVMMASEEAPLGQHACMDDPFAPEL